MLIENYVRNLLRLVLDKAKDMKNTALRNLYADCCVTTDKYAYILFLMVESAVPMEILVAWKRSSEKKDVAIETKLGWTIQGPNVALPKIWDVESLDMRDSVTE